LVLLAHIKFTTLRSMSADHRHCKSGLNVMKGPLSARRAPVVRQ